MNKVIKILKDIFLRRYIKEITFFSGTITWKECLIVLFSFFQGKSIVNGNDIKRLEEELGEYLGVKYVYSFGAGRMALYAILKAIDIKEGDEVILPGYTCVVVPNAVIYCGAKPIYVDIDPETLNVDINKIEEKITPNTKAIIIQHTFASFCDMDSINNIANKYNLMIVEDCAHALGAEYKGKKISTHGNAAFFTFEKSKIISTGMGGVAITNDENLANKIADIKNKAEFPDQKTIKKIVLQILLYNILGHPHIYFIGKYLLFIFSRLDLFVDPINKEEMEGKKPKEYPVKLSNIQAKIGLCQLKNIENNLKHRRTIAKLYRGILKEAGYKIPEQINNSYNPSYIRYWFLVKDQEKIKEFFRKNRVEIGEWFNSPIHPKEISLEDVFYKKGSCPIAEYIAEHNINLPTHLKVKSKDVERISKIISIIPNSIG